MEINNDSGYWSSKNFFKSHNEGYFSKGNIKIKTNLELKKQPENFFKYKPYPKSSRRRNSKTSKKMIINVYPAWNKGENKKV